MVGPWNIHAFSLNSAHYLSFLFLSCLLFIPLVEDQLVDVYPLTNIAQCFLQTAFLLLLLNLSKKKKNKKKRYSEALLLDGSPHLWNPYFFKANIYSFSSVILCVLNLFTVFTRPRRQQSNMKSRSEDHCIFNAQRASIVGFLFVASETKNKTLIASSYKTGVQNWFRLGMYLSTSRVGGHLTILGQIRETISRK